MIQLLLLGGAGIIYIFKASKVRSRTAKDIRGITVAEFQSWRDLQLRSYYWFSGTVWGVLLPQLMVFSIVNIADQAQVTVAVVFLVLLLLGGLTLHAAYNDRAKKLKQSFMERQGIKWVE